MIETIGCMIGGLVMLTLAALAAVTMTLPTLALLYTLMSVEDSKR